jgi:hypothetical protein
MALNAEWGPFGDASDARRRLFAFVDKSCGPKVGVVWAANGRIYPLRAPSRDGQGIGEIATFSWSPAPPPPPRQPHGLWESFVAFWDRYAEMEAESQRLQAQGNMAMANAIGSGISRMFHSHQDDAAGVALDVLCVALSIALLPTGLGAIGLLGLAGGAILLGADGVAYAKEIGGDEEGAEVWKHQTEGLRIVATVMTLPDMAFGGVKAVRELQEIRELRMVDRSTATAAERLMTRTSNAQRGARYAQIAERANLRAQIRTRQIIASMKLEITPRAAGVASVGLLLREEITGDHSAFQETLRRLRVHCSGNYR